MNWEEDLLNDLTRLQLDYYDNGSNGYTVAPNADAKQIIDKVSQLLKEQREICAEKVSSSDSLRFGQKVIIIEIILNAPEPELKGDVE